MKASPSLLSKTELFLSWKQKALALALLSLLLCLSLFIHYQHYKQLTEFDDYVTEVWVEKQYKKKDYWVLKLQSLEGFSFYTSSRENLKDIKGYHLRVKLFTQKLDYLSYLKGFYAPSTILSNLRLQQRRYVLIQDLEALHSQKSAAVYGALFLAGGIPNEIRQQLSALGINHLLAISGFHLGVLSVLLFFMLNLAYRPLQHRYFPYRNARRDISLAVLVLLCGYLYFLDFVPSLLRAFAMSVFAYFLYDRGMKIISFASLFIVVFFLIAIWPKLFFALGFWFSVAGVFYIFLFLHHMRELKAWQSFILLNAWVFIAMLPVVHYVFGSFSLYQLASPLMTMAFILFYPLVLALHLLSIGSVLDPLLDSLLEIDIYVVDIFINIWLLVLYLFVSLLAIVHRFFFFLLLFLSLSFLSYMLYGVTEF